MTHGSLFSGIGGFDLAAQWMGWENIFHCEYIDYKIEHLKKKFKTSISYGDITTTDFTVHKGRVDVLSGGFPCQDASIANGKGQKGLQGKRTGLFWEMLRAIKEIEPKYIIAENVANFLKTNGGSDIRTVLSELSRLGYNAEWRICRASEAGAPTNVPGCIWLHTPVASDCNRPKLSFPMYQRRHYRGSGNLTEQLYKLVGAVIGIVNPQLYAWMMGYPLNWLDSNYMDTEMQ
jgi:hypothetical protein